MSRLPVCLALCSLLSALQAEEKVFVQPDFSIPGGTGRLTVTGGDQPEVVVAAVTEFVVLSRDGKVKRRIPVGGMAAKAFQLKDGRFIGLDTYTGGLVALFRPDGSRQSVLISRAATFEDTLKGLFPDVTGWTTPVSAAVDEAAQRIYLIDRVQGGKNWWGGDVPDAKRILVVDFQGQVVQQIGLFLSTEPKSDPSDNVNFENVAVDPARKRVAAASRQSGIVRVWDYEGTRLTDLPGAGGVAFNAKGELATFSPDLKKLLLYDEKFVPVREVAIQTQTSDRTLDLAFDARGDLFVANGRPESIFEIYSSDWQTPVQVAHPFAKLTADLPSATLRAGQTVTVPFKSDVQLPGGDRWIPKVLWRSFSQGGPWQPLSSSLQPDGTLSFVVPPELKEKSVEVAVYLGEGMPRANATAAELLISKSYFIQSPDALLGLSIYPTQMRRVYRQGEAIAFQIANPSKAPPESGGYQVTVSDASGTVWSGGLGENVTSVEIPSEASRRLLPGRYTVTASAAGLYSYGFEFSLVSAAPLTSMQRILYQEFNNQPITIGLVGASGYAENIRGQIDYLAALRFAGFDRETDRQGARLDGLNPGGAANIQNSPVQADPASGPVAENLFVRSGEGAYLQEYLDRGAEFGLVYDFQQMGHCAPLPTTEEEIAPVEAATQMIAQRLENFPAFFGFNYNDEMFGGKVKEWAAQRKYRTPKRDSGWAPITLDVLAEFYHRVNGAVIAVNPSISRTATPMWQFPYVEGSYAPVIYGSGMTESYSHYLSEGHHPPFYAPHSIDILKRPGLPARGVFDGIAGAALISEAKGWEGYLKNSMLVVSRGVQGVGITHNTPLQYPSHLSQFAATNEVIVAYGDLFAKASPWNQAAVLYSKSEDITQKRHHWGTPHWEEVFAAYSAGLMSGVPMSITYEEDLEAGWLLQDGRPRFPMLLVPGSRAIFSEPVMAAIQAYRAAGGQVLTTQTHPSLPDAKVVSLHLEKFGEAIISGSDCDAIQPVLFPVLDEISQAMTTQVRPLAAFWAETSERYVAKNYFQAGAAKYVSLASETGPFPWIAPQAFSLNTKETRVYGETWLPRMTKLQLSQPAPVLIDVYERAVVGRNVAANQEAVMADLRYFPAKLYAILPAVPGPPQVSAILGSGMAKLRVQAKDESGKPMAAGIPLFIRVMAGDREVLRQSPLTSNDGNLELEVPTPVGSGSLTAEVTEMLTGKSSIVAIPLEAGTSAQALIQPRQAVDVSRSDLLARWLAEKKVSVYFSRENLVSSEVRTKLVADLQAAGFEVTVPGGAPLGPVRQGFSLLIAGAPGSEQFGEVLEKARTRGYFPMQLSARLPGLGRAFLCPVVGLNGLHDRLLCLVGGDSAGIEQGLGQLVKRAAGAPLPPKAEDATTASPIQGQPGLGSDLPRRVSEMFGARLQAGRANAAGTFLSVPAIGYQKNLALVEDTGSSGRVVRTARVGTASLVRSNYVSESGDQFGASSRVLDRFGDGFFLFPKEGEGGNVFAAFGDMQNRGYEFAASPKGDVVVSVGSDGAAGWVRGAAGNWKNAWRIDYWKEFTKLDWPVGNNGFRSPKFEAWMSADGATTFLLMSEFSYNGWTDKGLVGGAWFGAFDSKTGAEKWKWNVPLSGDLLTPTAWPSEDRQSFLIQVRKGSTTSINFVNYRVDASGKVSPSWTSSSLVVGFAARGQEPYGVAYSDRNVEIREAATSGVLWSDLWNVQVESLAAPVSGSLVLADATGRIVSLKPTGEVTWSLNLPTAASLFSGASGRLYAARWDGRLAAIDASGRIVWNIDLSKDLAEEVPFKLAAMPVKERGLSIHEVTLPSTISDQVPSGENLLRTDNATLKLGGIPGWMSSGTVLASADTLRDGDVTKSAGDWMDLKHIHWNALANRPVWAEIAFATPTDVSSLTLYEDPSRPDSHPELAVVQSWNPAIQKWETASVGNFLQGPVRTFPLSLKGVEKIRYVPLTGYFDNFRLSEIEVR